MATNPSMSGSRAARERSTLARLIELESHGTAFGTKLIHVQDEKAQNTAGGTFTSGAWRTRDLNTVKTNEITGASLASNQITLPAGTYYCEASAPTFRANQMQIRLYDITGSVVLALGTSTYSGSTTEATPVSLIAERFTLSVESVVELQHQCQNTQATNGLGVPANLATEVYASIRIWKVA